MHLLGIHMFSFEVWFDVCKAICTNLFSVKHPFYIHMLKYLVNNDQTNWTQLKKHNTNLTAKEKAPARNPGKENKSKVVSVWHRDLVQINHSLVAQTVCFSGWKFWIFQAEYGEELDAPYPGASGRTLQGGAQLQALAKNHHCHQTTT